MIYKIFTLSENREVMRFSNRIDAVGYMNFNDEERVDLYYVVEKQYEDFLFYHYCIDTLHFISKLGMIHGC